MSYQAMAWATSIKLPMAEKIVLLMLANRASHDDGSCYPSLNRVADECGVCRRTVINTIQKLEKKGLLKIVRTVKNNGENNSNKYYLTLGGSATDALGGSATDALGSATDALGGSATDAPKPVSSFNQSINQSIKKDISANADVKSTKKKQNEIPYKEIEKLYHECLPMLPQIYKWNDRRKAKVKSLWYSELEELAYWRNYFSYISRSKFLTGSGQCKDGRLWKADFDFIINEANFIKIAEGKYDG